MTKTTTLGLLLLWTCSFTTTTTLAAFPWSGTSEKSNKQQQQWRRRLTEENYSMTDVDAATGTVVPAMTKEALAAERAAKSCDGQLAQALVDANDATFRATEERDAARALYTNAQKKISELEGLVKGMMKEAETKEAYLNGKVEQLNEKLVVVNESQDQAVAAALDSVRSEMKAKDAKIAKLEHKLEQQAKDHDNILQVTKDEAKNYLVSQVRSIKAETEARVQEKDAIIAELELKLEQKDEEHENMLEATKEETKIYFVSQMRSIRAETEASLEEKDVIIVELEQKLEQKVKEHENMLEAIKEENKSYLESQAKSFRDEVELLKASHEDLLTKKEEDLKLAASEQGKLHEIVRLLEAKLAEYEEELLHWRSNFENRSYCNMTHIGADLYDIGNEAYSKIASLGPDLYEFGVETYKKAAEAASGAASNLNRNSQSLYHDMKFKAEVGLNRSKAIYIDQYEKYWPKVKPHYEEHVVPAVDKFLFWKAREVDPRWAMLQARFGSFKAEEIDPIYDVLKRRYNENFQRLAKMFGEECKQAYKFTRAFAKEKNISFDETFGPSMRQICQQPELAITHVAKGLVILLLLTFYRQILRLMGWVIGSVWSIFVTVTCLRFLLLGAKKELSPKKQLFDEPTKKKVSGKKKKNKNKVLSQ